MIPKQEKKRPNETIRRNLTNIQVKGDGIFKFNSLKKLFFLNIYMFFLIWPVIWKMTETLIFIK